MKPFVAEFIQCVSKRAVSNKGCQISPSQRCMWKKTCKNVNKRKTKFSSGKNTFFSLVKSIQYLLSNVLYPRWHWQFQTMFGAGSVVPTCQPAPYRTWVWSPHPELLRCPPEPPAFPGSLALNTAAPVTHIQTELSDPVGTDKQDGWGNMGWSFLYKNLEWKDNTLNFVVPISVSYGTDRKEGWTLVLANKWSFSCC